MSLRVGHGHTGMMARADDHDIRGRTRIIVIMMIVTVGVLSKAHCQTGSDSPAAPRQWPAAVSTRPGPSPHRAPAAAARRRRPGVVVVVGGGPRHRRTVTQRGSLAAICS